MENVQLTEQKLMDQYYKVNAQILTCKKSECLYLIKEKKHQYNKEFGIISLLGIAIAVGGIVLSIVIRI